MFGGMNININTGWSYLYTTREYELIYKQQTHTYCMLVLEGLVPRSWGCTMSQGDGMGTQSPTWTTPIRRHGQQFDICNNQVPPPLMLQLGSLLP